jgi:hypothetical protein
MSDQGDHRSTGDGAAGERRHRTGLRVLALGAAAVAVVGAAGTGFAVGTFVGGGGTQPEDVLPASTLVFADVDLDPAAEQKLNLARLLGRLPDVKDDYGPEPDLRSLILETVTEGTPLDDVDVEAWIGDRMGVAVVWDGATAVTPVVVLQSSDLDAAVDSLSAELGSEQVAVLDDYVLVTVPAAGDGGQLIDPPLPGTDPLDLPRVQTQTAAEVVAAAQATPLADSPAFSETFSHLEGGIASLFIDGAAAADAVRLLAPAEPWSKTQLDSLADIGQSAAVLRAEPDAVELVGWSTIALPPSAGSASLAPGLPEGTALAIEGTGGSSLVADRWRTFVDTADSAGLRGVRLERALAEIEARFGIELPGDLQTLAGEDAVLAVEASSILTGIPGVGVLSVTDPDAGADLAVRLQSSLDAVTGGFGIVVEGTDDGLVIATSAEYADTLASGDGSLGTTQRFGRALPDAADASYLAWVDLTAVTGPLLLTAPDAADAIAPLDSFGLTVGSDDGGTTLRARLVFVEEVL